MERFVCIHGHFYQPPRENPWLEAVEVQDSAYPYHDWNERITAECYAPNGFARILDADGRIVRLVNNYAWISFNFGPTLLSWLEEKSPEVYEAILAADRESSKRFSGHGGALAQAYNHVILPLASRRDKYTQVLWGIRDFEHRFGHKPEGMWLPETAVDLETLDILAELGIAFTILAPHQAGRVRKLGEQSWEDVGGGRIDPTMAYRLRLPSGRTIDLFFYDGPISRSIAFEQLLTKGENLVGRLLGAFSDARNRPQLVNIATDGESYGHHHIHGDMALAYALQEIVSHPDVHLTNYGEFLARHPPTHEVQIIEGTTWSCMHGLERWRNNCGCNSGRTGWNQEWRAPLRQALDWLRDQLAPLFEENACSLLADPWAARNAYISVIMDRSSENIGRFLRDHSRRELSHRERIQVLRLLELQRHAMLMYTSCGWFFDELSGPETVQVIQYAGRAIQLGQELFHVDLEQPFLQKLEQARSNLAEHGNGSQIYRAMVKPAIIDWEQVGAHYAVSSFFEEYPEQVRIFCYTADREHFETFESGKVKLVVGRIRATSEITQESNTLSFGAIHFGDHNVSCGVRRYSGEEVYEKLVAELAGAFGRADFPEIIRLIDRGFGKSTYSLRSLFRDEQRRVMKRVLQAAQSEVEASYRRLYEQNLPTMRFLVNLGAPLPAAFLATAEFLISTDLRWALSDDEPNFDQVRSLLGDAAAWQVKLDTAGLSYRFKKAIGRIVSRCREHPTSLPLLETLTLAVELARSLPFEVDLWDAQNVYWQMMHGAFGQCLSRIADGDGAARLWIDHFLVLGDKLGMQTADLRKRVADMKQAPTIADRIEEIFAACRIPRATYRLQLHPKFPFASARAIVPYLNDLGISDLYVSPILKARPGSTHGYDICDHGRLNPELGDEPEFNALVAALQQAGMGLVVDIVPNHMGIMDPSNTWWMDVLENGPSSIYASWFDIDWDPVNPNLENKVLLPILGDQYGTVLEAGQIRLAYENGAFFFHYFEIKLPVAPRTYIDILNARLDELTRLLGPEHDHLLELRSILTALTYLPPRTALPPEKIIERNREKEIIKRRIAALYQASAEVRTAIDATIRQINGSVGDRRSFDRLDQLLGGQAYRPAYWRVATEEINYRRFFDINELAAIRMEEPAVFHATHQLIFRLLGAGKITGLRIDHPDGLWNPTRYFRQLQENFLEYRLRTVLGENRPGAVLASEISRRLDDCLQRNGSTPPAWPLYVVAEKILGPDEPLPTDWAVHGTTGYDFLNSVNGLLVQQCSAETSSRIYTEFVGKAPDFNEMIVSNQRMILRESMASELNALGHELDRISERNRRYRDFTLNSLTLAIREVIACLFIYRTYITGPEDVTERSRRFIEQAVEQAKNENPRLAEAIFHFIRDTLLFRNLDDFREEDRPLLFNWVMKFQQLTGPVIAKALEDTAFYVYNRLVSLNEVGGHPQEFGIDTAAFHRLNFERRQHWPHNMLASSTHDTKRSEDVRARISVLSEIPDEWQAAIGRWHRLNAGKKTVVEGQPAPDRNDEYLLYQTLIGAWPAALDTPADLGGFRERIDAYMGKAIKEAKVHTSWINPQEAYDKAMRDFVARILPDRLDDPFLQDLRQFQQRVAFFGWFNSLSQVLLKMTCPGVPDFYQGNELWDFSLVDPDNRRPVDFAQRQQLLAGLKERVGPLGHDLLRLTAELLRAPEDGRIKLYVIWRTLQYRRHQAAFFRESTYLPLEISGARKQHPCAFARQQAQQAVLVVIPRLIVGLCRGKEQPPIGPDCWSDTWLHLPDDLTGTAYRNLFTGELLRPGIQEGIHGLPLAQVLANFPVALLIREVEAQEADARRTESSTGWDG